MARTLEVTESGFWEVYDDDCVVAHIVPDDPELTGSSLT